MALWERPRGPERARGVREMPRPRTDPWSPYTRRSGATGGRSGKEHAGPGRAMAQGRWGR